MQFAICRSGEDSRTSVADTLEQNGLNWLKFGDQYFCYAEEPAASIDWMRLKAAGAFLNRATLGAGQPEKGSLYLVTQEGRLFQRAQPDVLVLFDRGRHLLVLLDERSVDKIVQHDARFSIRPVVRNEIIYERLVRPEAPPRINRRTNEIVDAISQASFAARLTELASHPTRHSLSSHFREAANQARDQLSLMGYQVSLQPVSIPGGETLNVVADKRGLGSERSVTLVSAHLDSVNHPADHTQPDDPTAPAPGADDNGSGSAGVIEIARVLKDQPIIQDLRLVLFGGEEQGLYGSKHYVNQLSSADRQRIRSVVNMDMIGVDNTGRPGVLLEGRKPVSESMIAGLSSMAHAYTRLTVDVSWNPWGSDHRPFIDANVPAVLTIEGHDDDNHNIHTANDTLNHINHDLALEILRMNTAFIIDEIGLEGSATG